MKRLITIVLFAIVSSCKKDTIIENPSTIDGLELTFVNVNSQQRLTAICFVDENTGIVTSYGGEIFKTTDGGSSWLNINSNTSLPLLDIFFLNKNEGFIVGGRSNCGGTEDCSTLGAIILHTINGGQTWEQIYRKPAVYHNPLEGLELHSIYFPSDTIGFAVGLGTVLSTKDKGITWQTTKIDSLGGVMLDVKFANNEKGLAVCTMGKLVKTTNGGNSWTVSSPFPATGGRSLSFVFEDLIYSAGYTNIAKSTDFGNTWTELSNYPKDIFKLNCITNDIVFAFGRGGYSGGEFGYSYGSIYYTTNGGANWIGNDKIHELTTIEVASFPLPNLGFAASGKTVVKIKRK